mmetsp:Transcript_16049/g.22771  ORF Transcript_16049/g.22771 Transcript_16049/m.22771 type:complete len:86 (-) Transcript_16049:763-1020(-)
MTAPGMMHSVNWEEKILPHSWNAFLLKAVGYNMDQKVKQKLKMVNSLVKHTTIAATGLPLSLIIPRSEKVSMSLPQRQSRLGNEA